MRTLRIGIDARPLCSPTTGIGRYTAEIVRRIGSTQHAVFLYATEPLPANSCYACHKHTLGHLQAPTPPSNSAHQSASDPTDCLTCHTVLPHLFADGTCRTCHR